MLSNEYIDFYLAISALWRLIDVDSGGWGPYLSAPGSCFRSSWSLRYHASPLGTLNPLNPGCDSTAGKSFSLVPRLTQLPYISFICNTLPRTLCTGGWPGAPRRLPASSDDAFPGCTSSTIRVILKSWDCYIRVQSQARDPACVRVCVCAQPAGMPTKCECVCVCVSACMCVSVVSLFACVKQLLLDEFHTEIIDVFFFPTRNPAAKLFRDELKDDLNLMIIISNVKESMAAFYESVTAHKSNDVNLCIVLLLFPVLENVGKCLYFTLLQLQWK